MTIQELRDKLAAGAVFTKLRLSVHVEEETEMGTLEITVHSILEPVQLSVNAANDLVLTVDL